MARQPNIIWIVTTQWRAQAFGYAGDPNARTPWLDALASESENYTQAVTPHPMGPHARAALLTGKLCPGNGVSDYWDPLPADARTIAHAMRERGYTTAFFGKWHLAERDQNAPLVGEAHAKMIVPVDRRGGFGLWEGFESGFLINDPWLHGTRLAEPRHFKGYQSDVVIDRAAEWLREAQARPFFCVVSLESPHPPYGAPAPNVEWRNPSEIILRGNVPLGGEIEKNARTDLAGYYRHVEATDRSIGRLLAEIELSDTIVVFTSVHGDMHGSHGHFRKGWPYEESICVPLLVHRPKVRMGSREDLVSLCDLPRMALAWTEEEEFQFSSAKIKISMPMLTKIQGQCPFSWSGFRTSSQKLVHMASVDILAERRLVSLKYDLLSDPLETRNLASSSWPVPEVTGEF
jgi:arylsulfatase A-like enzyme